jgi:hypothetical protein
MTLDAMRLRAKFSVDIFEIRLAHERHRFRMLAPHTRAGRNTVHVCCPGQTISSPYNAWDCGTLVRKIAIHYPEVFSSIHSRATVSLCGT